MIEVKVIDWSPELAITVKYELEEMGFARGVDFDFAYHPPVWTCHSNLSWTRSERLTIYTFYDETIASWFNLKYTNYVQE